MGREIKYGLLIVLFLIVVSAIFWDWFNLKEKASSAKADATSPPLSGMESGDEEIMEFRIGGDIPPVHPPPSEETAFDFDEPDEQGMEEEEQGKLEKENSPSEVSSSPPLLYRKHTVAPGDSLAKISKKYLGRESAWRGLADFNKIKNPLRLQVGKVIVIPLSSEEKIQNPPAQASPVETVQREYRIRKGDSLYTIAKALLGSGNKWRQLASLNSISDPRKIRPGMVLKVP